MATLLCSLQAPVNAIELVSTQVHDLQLIQTHSKNDKKHGKDGKKKDDGRSSDHKKHHKPSEAPCVSGANCKLGPKPKKKGEKQDGTCTGTDCVFNVTPPNVKKEDGQKILHELERDWIPLFNGNYNDTLNVDHKYVETLSKDLHKTTRKVDEKYLPPKLIDNQKLADWEKEWKAAYAEFKKALDAPPEVKKGAPSAPNGPKDPVSDKV